MGEIARRQEATLLLAGLTESRRARALPDLSAIGEAEFKVFSQFGEDGILQYLFAKARPAREFFVEIGVQNYVESNTRFLLLQDNWEGSVVDGSEADIAYIQQDDLYWRHSLRALCRFVTAENVEAILAEAGAPKDLGLLSIDVDGNDYWIWQAVRDWRPSVVVCEYNSLFGSSRAVTVPYQSDFHRTRAHSSNLYFGVSLAALCHLAEQKGYQFVGANRAGNNAFFVRKEAGSRLPALEAKAGFVKAKFRESRSAEGELTFLGRAESLAQIADLPLLDVTNGKTIRVGELA